MWRKRPPKTRAQMKMKNEISDAERLGVGTDLGSKGANAVDGLKQRLKGKLKTLDKCVAGLVPRNPLW